MVFGNSYQRASKYWFYSGQVTYSLNSYRERRNNYYFWPVEDSLLGKPVYMFDIFNLDSFPQKIKTGIGTLGYKYDSAFVSLAKVQFVPSQKIYRTTSAQRVVMKYKVTMPDHYWNYLKTHSHIDAEIFLSFFNGSFAAQHPSHRSARKRQEHAFETRANDLSAPDAGGIA